MKVLLIETEDDGHYVSLYLKLLIKELLKKNFSVSLLITKKIFKNKNYSFLKNKRIEFFFIKEIKKPIYYNFFFLFIYQIKFFFNLKNYVTRVKSVSKPDLIYMNTFDHIDKAAALFGSPFGKSNFFTMILKTKFHLKYFNIGPNYFLNFLYKKAFIRVCNIKTLKKIFVIDKLISNYAKKIRLKKVVYVQDAVDIDYYSKIKKNKLKKLSFEFKKKYSIDNNCYTILIYGAIRKNKNIKYLIDAIKNKVFKKKIKLLIAGKQDGQMKNYLNNLNLPTSAKNLELINIDHYISEQLEAIIFNVSDLVWVGYSDSYGSSGVFFLSAFMNVPVLTFQNGLIYHMNKLYKIGISIDSSNPNNVVSAINLLMNRQKSEFKNKFYNFTSKYNNESFSEKIVKELIN